MKPVDQPASMSVRGPVLKPSMLLMVLDLFEGENTTVSPTRTRPDSMRPATMRRSSPWLVNL